MQKIVECVPNISEGKDENIINKVIDSAKEVPGVTFLDIEKDPGTSLVELITLFIIFSSLPSLMLGTHSTIFCIFLSLMFFIFISKVRLDLCVRNA
ncbi:MAG TPA: hypothetical protein VMW66_00895, partial [Elusimicrobiales bacterium]|nr:hypothetical protein [Elusimicrobiales bacterium]